MFWQCTSYNLLYTGNLQIGTLANSKDPDEMQHYAAFHQGLHCLLLKIKQPTGSAPDNFSTIISTVLVQIAGRIAQLVTCLATEGSLSADPGVASSIPDGSHTFMEIDYEIISTVILLPSAKSFKKGCCQLQAKVCVPSTG